MGFEPTTFCMASRRSSQLSYSRRGASIGLLGDAQGVECLAAARVRIHADGAAIALGEQLAEGLVELGLGAVDAAAEAPDGQDLVLGHLVDLEQLDAEVVD